VHFGSPMATVWGRFGVQGGLIERMGMRRSARQEYPCCLRVHSVMICGVSRVCCRIARCRLRRYTEAIRQWAMLERSAAPPLSDRALSRALMLTHLPRAAPLVLRTGVPCEIVDTSGCPICDMRWDTRPDARVILARPTYDVGATEGPASPAVMRRRRRHLCSCATLSTLI
jgi:hypothetical protein